MEKIKAASLVLAFMLISLGAAQQSKNPLDTFKVAQGSSPCSAITVNIFDGTRNVMKAIIFWSGKKKPIQDNLNSFVAGRKYSIQATCISSRGFSQGANLDYTASSKSISVTFLDGGFTLK